MKKKPFSPLVHGINDYAFAAIQAVVPPLLGINKKAQTLHKVLAGNVVLYNSLTDQPVAVKHLIPYKTHGKIDCATIAGLALATLYKPIRKDKRALAFHIGLIALAVTNVLLTDWDAK